MARIVKGLFQIYIELENMKLMKPKDGAWYDERQYCDGKLGERLEVFCKHQQAMKHE